MLDSFFQFKAFSKDYFQQILVEVENDLQSVNDGIYYTFSNLSKDDFFDIFYQFMRSIHLDKLLDYYWNNNLIYSVFYSNNQNDLGYTLFNPINKLIFLIVFIPCLFWLMNLDIFMILVV